MNVKRLIVLSAALLVVLCALPIFAANVTGNWTMDDKDGDGNPFTATYFSSRKGPCLPGPSLLLTLAPPSINKNNPAKTPTKIGDTPQT